MLWSTIYLFGELCCPHRNVKEYGDKLIHTGSKVLYCKMRQCKRDLAKSMEEMNHKKIQRFMLNQNAHWIVWKRNHSKQTTWAESMRKILGLLKASSHLFLELTAAVYNQFKNSCC